MGVSSCGLSKRAQRVSFRRECRRLPGEPPESSAYRDLVRGKPAGEYLPPSTHRHFYCWRASCPLPAGLHSTLNHSARAYSARPDNMRK
jgi:hypothetical protein